MADVNGEQRVVPSLLIVDDNEADIVFSRIMAQRSGRFERIEGFTSPEKALGLFLDYERSRLAHGEWFPPRVLFLDINMPRMTGFEFLEAYGEVAEELKARGQAPAIVVMVTSSDLSSDRERAESSPWVSDFIIKPITLENAIKVADRFGLPSPDDS